MSDKIYSKHLKRKGTRLRHWTSPLIRPIRAPVAGRESALTTECQWLQPHCHPRCLIRLNEALKPPLLEEAFEQEIRILSILCFKLRRI